MQIVAANCHVSLLITYYQPIVIDSRIGTLADVSISSKGALILAPMSEGLVLLS
jgi:hypothetical protein